MRWLAPVFGISSVSPLVLAQAVGGSNAEPVTWLTGAVVIAVVTAFYKFLTTQVRKLEAEVDRLTKAAERRAEDDRAQLLPLLSRSIEAQAAYITRHLDAETKES
jgi:outer membrane murein-binding lipoprotein Lpp